MLGFQRLTLVLLPTLFFLLPLRPEARAYDHSSSAHHPLSSANADAILGYWQRGEGEAVIEIRERPDGYHGVIVESERHPDVIGTEIFKLLRYDAEARLWRGRVYSIDRDRDFKIQMTLPDPDRFVIRLRLLFFSRSVEFKRQSGQTVAENRTARR